MIHPTRYGETNVVIQIIQVVITCQKYIGTNHCRFCMLGNSLFHNLSLISYMGGGAAILAVSSFILFNYYIGVTSKGRSPSLYPRVCTDRVLSQLLFCLFHINSPPYHGCPLIAHNLHI